jgi:hypothetical protein
MNSQPDATNRQAQPLEPLAPSRAKSLYLESQSDELAELSLELHEKHIGSFVEWCAENGIKNVGDVTARSVHEYQLDIKDGFAQSTVRPLVFQTESPS